MSNNPRSRLIIFDGPPASGKTTLCRFLSSKYHCLVLTYKRLGLSNVISLLLLKHTGSNHDGLVNSASLLHRNRIDPLLLLNKRFLTNLSTLIFVSEILYKAFQALKLLLALLVYRGQCLIVDEFMALSMSNYINLFLHRGLNKKHLEVLLRLDLSTANTLFAILGEKMIYYYIDRPLPSLVNLWRKRSPKQYDVKYLAMVRTCWRIIKQQFRSKNLKEILIG